MPANTFHGGHSRPGHDCTSLMVLAGCFTVWVGFRANKLDDLIDIFPLNDFLKWLLYFRVSVYLKIKTCLSQNKMTFFTFLIYTKV